MTTFVIQLTDSINHNFARIRIDTCNSLPIEKMRIKITTVIYF